MVLLILQFCFLSVVFVLGKPKRLHGKVSEIFFNTINFFSITESTENKLVQVPAWITFFFF